MASTSDSSERILEICQILSEQEQLQATFKEAGKGFLYAGSGAALGTLFGGPVGLLIGGALGSALGAYNCQGNCRSVVSVIRYDMTHAQQQRLINSVKRALEDVSAQNIIVLLSMVLESGALREAAVKEIVRFIRNEMDMAISYS